MSLFASNSKLLNVKLSCLPDGPVIFQPHSVFGLYVYGKLGEFIEFVGAATVRAQFVVTFTKNRLPTNVNNLSSSPKNNTIMEVSY